ncbi:glycosyltransferase [Desulfocastanea catecholica]
MHFVRYFKQFAEVDLVYSQIEEPEIADSNIFHKCICVPLGENMNELLRNLYFFILRLPWCILSKYSASFKKRLLRLIYKENYDLIFVRYSVFAQYLISLPLAIRSEICLDFDDVLSGSIYEEMYAVSTRYEFKKRLDFKNLVAYEAKCCDRFGTVLFCSEGDLNLVAGKKRDNRFVVPNVISGVGSDGNFALSELVAPHSLLFVGALNYLPNCEGILWFVKEIFPEFKAQFPGARLSIVGRKPGKLLQEIAQDKDIDIYADVPEVVPYYRQCSVVIVPLLQGSGTRIKILESALLNRPVMSTEKGAEGLDFTNGKEILIFHDSKSFIRQYRKLQNRDFYLEVVKRSRIKVEECYSVNYFNRKMDDVIFRDELN